MSNSLVFYPTEPPAVKDILHPVQRSDYCTKGTSFTIEKNTEDFDRVLDPTYLWQSMPKAAESEWNARELVKTNKNAAVHHYIVRRQHFWNFIKIFRTDLAMQYKLGMLVSQEYTRETITSKTTTHDLGISLGLEVGTNPATGAQAKGIGSLSYNLTVVLQESVREVNTHHVEHSEEITLSFEPCTYYAFWQLSERIAVFRVDMNAAGGAATTEEEIPGLEVVTPLGHITCRAINTKPEGAK